MDVRAQRRCAPTNLLLRQGIPDRHLSTGAELGATCLYHSEETYALPAIVPLAILEIHSYASSTAQIIDEARSFSPLQPMLLLSV